MSFIFSLLIFLPEQRKRNFPIFEANSQIYFLALSSMLFRTLFTGFLIFDKGKQYRTFELYLAEFVRSGTLKSFLLLSFEGHNTQYMHKMSEPSFLDSFSVFEYGLSFPIPCHSNHLGKRNYAILYHKLFGVVFVSRQ